MRALDAATVIARTDGLIEAEVDNEIVALKIEKGTCYGLNRTGSRVWKLLAKPIRVSEMCATLIAEYSIDPKVCETDVLDLLEELRAEGLIAAVDQK
jgi:Coenzyme PQQ synthesis protein D (PqqD)